MPEQARPFTEFAGELTRHHRAWIAAACQPRGLDYLARHAGISRSALYSWFSGRHLPQEALLARLLKALDVAEADRLALLRLRAGLGRDGAPPSAGSFARPLPGPPMKPGEFSGRDWAVRRILDWRERPDHLLLVTAVPGGGKTRLAAHLAEAVGGVSALHYCRQRDAGSLDPVGVVEHLARQLAGSVAGFRETLTAVTGADSDSALESAIRSERTPRLAFDRFIRRPLRELGAPSTMVVIDGFDEAAEGDAGRHLANMLVREAHQPPPGLKLLVTSRPVPLLDAFPECDRVDLVEDETVTGGDVFAYANARLAPHLAEAASVARHVAEHSSGNFLYASFVVDDLLDGPPNADLASIRLPDGLAALYREFLDRELTADPGAWRNLYRPLLGLLTQARGDGLRPSQLAELTGRPASTVDDALDLCAPYLHRPGPGGPVRLFHQSFADYLRRPGRHHAYPDEAAERLLSWATRAVGDPHATGHLLAYALDALELAGERARPAVLDLLASLAADTAFLHSRALSGGAAPLSAELNRVVEASGCTDLPVLRLAKTLAAQDVALRGWDPAAAPGRWLQQIRYQALRDGDTALAAALDAHPEPPARVLWTHGARGRPENGHGDTVSCIAGSADGLSASGSYDMTVRVLDPSGKTLALLDHPGPVTELAFVGERWLAVAFDHHLVHLWNLDDTSAPQVLGHDDRVTHLLATGAGTLVTAGEDGTARVWEPGVRRPLHTFRHRGPVTGLADTGRYLVTASAESHVSLWDLADGTLHSRLPHDGPVRHVAAASGLVAGASGSRVVLWDPLTGAETGATTLPEAVTALIFAPDGALLVTAGTRIHRWHGGAAVLVAEHAEQITATAPYGESGSVLSASRDKTARLTRRDGTALHFRHDGWIRSAAVGGDAVVTGSDDRGVRAWDPATGAVLWELAGDTDAVLDLAYSGDGSLLLAASADGTLRVHDAATGRVRRVLPHEGPVKAFAEQAGLLLTCDTVAARVWRTADDQAPVTLHYGPVTAAVALGAGLAATGGAEGHAAIWDLAAASPVTVLKGHIGAVTALAAGGGLLVTCSPDGTARVWDAAGRAVRVLEHPDEVRGAVVNADGSVLTTCMDGVVRLWPPDLGRARELGRHTGPAKAVAMAGAFAVTGSRDQSARIWGLPDGRPLPVLRHDGWVRDVAVTAGARHVLTCSDDRTARWWDPAEGTELHRFGCHNRISRVAPHPHDPGLAALGTTQGEVLAIRVVDCGPSGSIGH